MNHTLYKTQDHPEANGRKALAGESEYPLTFTLDSGELLTVRLGQAGFDTVTNLLMDMISRAPSHDDGSLTITPYWKLKNQNESLALRLSTLESELSRADVEREKYAKCVVGLALAQCDNDLIAIRGERGRLLEQLAEARLIIANLSREKDEVKNDIPDDALIEREFTKLRIEMERNRIRFLAPLPARPATQPDKKEK